MPVHAPLGHVSHTLHFRLGVQSTVVRYLAPISRISLSEGEPLRADVTGMCFYGVHALRRGAVAIALLAAKRFNFI